MSRVPAGVGFRYYVHFLDLLLGADLPDEYDTRISEALLKLPRCIRVSLDHQAWAEFGACPRAYRTLAKFVKSDTDATIRIVTKIVNSAKSAKPA